MRLDRDIQTKQKGDSHSDALQYSQMDFQCQIGQDTRLNNSEK